MVEINQPMMIIRKRLWAGEMEIPFLRLNIDTDTVQITPDGGETWVDAPALDPRHSDELRLPALTGEDAKCDAAARMVAQFQDHLIIFENSVNAAQFATNVMVILLALSPFASILVGLALLGFDVLTEIGQANIEAAFTEGVWDDLLCSIVCHIGEDGQMSESQRDEVMADMLALHPGVVYNTLVNMVNLFGEVMLSNAGVDRTEVGDCGECACQWTYQWDFTANDGDFVHDPVNGYTTTDGAYNLGFGWYPTTTPSSNGCGTITSSVLQSAAFDIPAGCHVTEIIAIADSTGVCGHFEVNIGETRAEGLGRDLQIYASNHSGTQSDTGDIAGADTNQRVRVARINNSGTGYIGIIQISGTGDQPDFTGGEFL